MKNLSCFPPPKENVEQKELINWWNKAVRPEYQDLLFAIPNGGWRRLITAVHLKAEGVRAGVPDLFLAIPCGGYGGLFLEMKRRNGGRLSEAQKRVIHKLENIGYAVAVCPGCMAAKDKILKYLLLDFRLNGGMHGLLLA